MNSRIHSDTVPASAPPSSSAQTSSTSSPPEPLEVLEDFEARSAWFHFQKWAGLVAQDLDRTVGDLIHSFGHKHTHEVHDRHS